MTRRIAITLVVAIATAIGPGVAVRAQDPSTGAIDACALLTDAEVLEATGASAVTSMEPASSLAAAGFGQGCTRRLETAAGLSGGATFTLDYGLQSPGGRQLYEGQLAVMTDPVHVGGLGDDAFEGLSGEWYAVRDDATTGLQLLAIGVFDPDVHRLDIAGRSLMWRMMSRLPAGPGPTNGTGPLCLLSASELSASVGLAFEEDGAAGDLNCLYQGGADPGEYALDIRLEDPPFGMSDASLDLVSLGSGEATTVEGLPAWTSDEALWVDVGSRLLVIQPMFLPGDGQRPLGEVLASIAQVAVERLPPELASPTAAATPSTDIELGALFPTELKGAPVDVQTVVGTELGVMLGDPARLEPIEAAVAAQGRTIDDLSVGVADLFNANDRSGSITAIRLRGADAATFGIPLLLALQGIPDLAMGQTEVIIGLRTVTVLEIPGRDPALPLYVRNKDDIAWFIEADTCVRYTPEQGCEESQVDRPLLEEIIAKLP